MIDARQKLFSMRTDSDEGQRFLDALDDLRMAELPTMTRTDMVKKLVFETHKKMKGKRA